MSRLELWTEELIAAELIAAGRLLREEATTHARVDLCIAGGCTIHEQPPEATAPRAVRAHLRRSE
jgi:hypothetical protein